ncbi:MAG: hypothetical protein D6731_24410, partial [Planctomycetota bacterium]
MAAPAAPDTSEAPAPAESPAELPEVAAGVSSWAVAWRQFRKDRLAMFGVALVLVLGGVAVFAPLLANGRPLYVRGYLTDFYDADAAAFADWHRRLIHTVQELRAGVPRRDLEATERRYRLYVEGLPRVLQRLADNLPGPLREELLTLRGQYTALLAAPRSDIDLDALDVLGQRIERRFGALSLSSAYKRAALPLLELSEVFDAVRDGRETLAARDATADERAEAKRALAAARKDARRIAGTLAEATLSVQTFLDATPRDRLARSTGALCRGLLALADDPQNPSLD